MKIYFIIVFDFLSALFQLESLIKKNKKEQDFIKKIYKSSLITLSSLAISVITTLALISCFIDYSMNYIAHKLGFNNEFKRHII